MSITALQTKDIGTMIMEAYGKGFVKRTDLKNLSILLPEMKKTFKEAMSAVYEMTEDLIVNVDSMQQIIPTNGTISEGAGSQALVELVKTGSAMIRKVTGVVEEAL